MRLKKLIAIQVTCWLLFPHLQWAFAETTYTSEIVPLQIPPYLGTVIDQWHPPGSSVPPELLVIHIQDLHCHAEAQRRIAALIRFLAHTYGVSLIGVEGSNGPVDASKLATFPEPKAKREIGQALLNQGWLTGPEYLAATTNLPIQLEGVENAALHGASEACLKTFLTEECLGMVADLQDGLETVKTSVYPPALATLDHQRTACLQGLISTQAYARWLRRTASQIPGLDPAVVRLAGNLQFSVGPDVDVNFWAAADQVDQALRELQFQQEDERRVDSASRFLEIAEKMLAISATSRELRWWRQRRSEDRWQEFQHLWDRLAPLGAQGADLSLFKQQLDAADAFYQLADQRSDQLVHNLLKAAKRRDVRLTVLVTGGYHTEKILSDLRAQQIALVNIRPRLTLWESPAPYYSRLHPILLPLDGYLGPPTGAFAPPSLLPIGPKEAGLAEEDLPAPKRRLALRLDLGLKLFSLWSSLRTGELKAERVRRLYRSLALSYPRNNPLVIPSWDGARLGKNAVAMMFSVNTTSLWAEIATRLRKDGFTSEPPLEVLQGDAAHLRFFARRPSASTLRFWLASIGLRLSDLMDRGQHFLRAAWDQALDLAWSLTLMLPSLPQPLFLLGLLWFASLGETEGQALAAGWFPLASIRSLFSERSEQPDPTYQPSGLKPGQLFRIPGQGVFIITRVASFPDRAEYKAVSGSGLATVKRAQWFFNNPQVIFLRKSPGSSGGVRWAAFTLVLLAVAWLLVSSVMNRVFPPLERPETVRMAAPDTQQTTRMPETLQVAPAPLTSKPIFVSCPPLPGPQQSVALDENQFFPLEFTALRDLFAILCNLNVLSQADIQTGLHLIAEIEELISFINLEPEWALHPGLLDLLAQTPTTHMPAENFPPELDQYYQTLTFGLDQLYDIVNAGQAATELAQKNQERQDLFGLLQNTLDETHHAEIKEEEYKPLCQQQTELINDLRSQGIGDGYIADLLGLEGTSRNFFLTLGLILDGSESDTKEWPQTIAYFYNLLTQRYLANSEQFWLDAKSLQAVIMNPKATPEQIEAIKSELDLYYFDVQYFYFVKPADKTSFWKAPGRSQYWNSLGAVSRPLLNSLAAFFTVSLGLALPLGIWAGVGLPLSLAASVVAGGILVGALWSVKVRRRAQAYSRRPRAIPGSRPALLLPRLPIATGLGAPNAGWLKLPRLWWQWDQRPVTPHLRSPEQAI